MITEARTTDLVPIILARTLVCAEEGFTALIAENPKVAAVDQAIGMEIYYAGVTVGFIEAARMAKTLAHSDPSAL